MTVYRSFYLSYNSIFVPYRCLRFYFILILHFKPITQFRPNKPNNKPRDYIPPHAGTSIWTTCIAFLLHMIFSKPLPLVGPVMSPLFSTELHPLACHTSHPTSWPSYTLLSSTRTHSLAMPLAEYTSSPLQKTHPHLPHSLHPRHITPGS